MHNKILFMGLSAWIIIFIRKFAGFSDVDIFRLLSFIIQAQFVTIFPKNFVYFFHSKRIQKHFYREISFAINYSTEQILLGFIEIKYLRVLPFLATQKKNSRISPNQIFQSFLALFSSHPNYKLKNPPRITMFFV